MTRTQDGWGAEGISGRVKFLPLAWAGMPKTSFRKNSDSPLALLEYCATLGDTVAVGVASDEVVKLYKPNIPVIPLEQRIEMLQALRCVDIVLPYHELDYIEVCKEVKADIFVIGEDWGRKPHNQGIEDFLKSQGKEVVQIQYSPRNSSTKIKKDVLSLHQTGKRV